MFTKKRSNSDSKVFLQKNYSFDFPNQEFKKVTLPKEYDFEKNFKKIVNDEVNIN